MNKEKLILDSIREKAYRVNRTARPVYGQGQYDMTYEILSDVEKIIQSEPEENIHDIIYDFITQYDDRIGLAIATQDYDLLNDSIKDYLDESFREHLKEPQSIGDKVRNMTDNQLCRLFKKIEEKGVGEFLSKKTEMTNFDVITESPEGLAFYLFGQMQNCMTCCTVPEAGECEENKPKCKNHIIDWLNQKAGE